MTRASAPGKLVISGAYAVLEGAPAITTAVDRYVIADSARAAELITPEVAVALEAAALHGRRAPWFDASGLRHGNLKLGLGSSAAILVASVAVLLAADNDDPQALKREVARIALDAHRRAQGGGSGVDVATSVEGGTLALQRNDQGLHYTPAELPVGLWIEAWATGTPASTPHMLRGVAEFRGHSPGRYRKLLDALAREAELTLEAMRDADASRFVECLFRQTSALRRLGDAASVPIVTDSLWAMLPELRRQGVTCHPAGAGGGDICLLVGVHPRQTPTPSTLQRAGYRPLDLGLAAPGLQLASEPRS